MDKKDRRYYSALEWVNGFDEVIGAVAIINDKIGAIGNIKLVKWN